MARIYVHASNTALATATTAWISQTSVTANVTSGKRYAIFWASMISNTAINSDSRVRLQNTTDAVTLQQFNIESQDTTDRISVNDISVVTAASTGILTFSVDIQAEGGTVSGTDAYITVLELDDADLASTTSTAVQTTSNTYTTLDSINVPAGDWFIFGSMGVDTNQTAQLAADYGMRIFDGTTAYMERVAIFINDNTNFTPYSAVASVSPTATTTYSLDYKSNGTAQFTAQYRTILALDKSKFAATYHSIDEGLSNSSNNVTPITKLTYTPTISNTRNHLTLGFWTTTIASTANSVNSSFSTVAGSTSEPGLYTAARFPRREASDVDDQFSYLGFGW